MTKMFWCPNVSAKNDQNISAKKKQHVTLRVQEYVWFGALTFQFQAKVVTNEIKREMRQ